MEWLLDSQAYVFVISTEESDVRSERSGEIFLLVERSLRSIRFTHFGRDDKRAFTAKSRFLISWLSKMILSILVG